MTVPLSDVHYAGLTHEPPKKNVLLVTCMDLRLLDNVVAFMAHENLTNRYDQFISAGTSLALATPEDAKPDPFGHWRQAFYDHLELAVALHHITHIYLIEHRDCGAYKYGAGIEYGKVPAADRSAHEQRADRLAREIREYCELKRANPSKIPVLRKSEAGGTLPPFRVRATPAQLKPLGKMLEEIHDEVSGHLPKKMDWEISISSFLMDLRGHVEQLSEFPWP